MLGVLLVFSWYFFNCDVTFKITNKLKVNNNNFKSNGDFKSHITIEKTLGEPLTFFILKWFFFLFFSFLKSLSLFSLTLI